MVFNFQNFTPSLDDSQASSSESPSFVLKRAFSKIFGLAFVGSTLLLAIALTSWSADDPSLTNARAGLVRNWLGVPGATISDLMMQFIGLSSVVFLIPPFFWGVAYMYNKKSRYGWICILAWINAICFSAMGASSARQSISWPLPKGMGGILGDSLLAHMRAFLDISPISVDSALLGVSCAFMGAVLCVIASGYCLPYESFVSLPTQAGDKSKNGVFGKKSIENLKEVPDPSPKKRLRFLRWSASRVFKSIASVLLAMITWIMRFRRPGETLPVGSGMTSRREPALAFSHQEGSVPPVASVPHVPPSKNLGAPQIKKRLSLWNRGASESSEVLEEYALPSLELLQDSFYGELSHEVQHDLNAGKAQLEMVLSDFGIRGVIRHVRPGPVVTLYELEPAPGTKSARVISLADDIARSLSAVSARVAVIPGRNVIGIELPNPTRKIVYLRELLESQEFVGTRFKLPLCLGKAIGGEPVVVELAQMPHLLVAGTTGSGKSVAINTMILSLLYRLTPEECRMIMVDPKMLELSVYDGIPHLLTPVVTDPKQAVIALKWVVREMEERYKKMSKLGVRNIVGFNSRVQEAKTSGKGLRRRVQTGFDHQTGQATYEDEEMDLDVLPYIVVIVDEMADLMLVAGKEIEGHIQRLAQMARASGIHVILATQRPSVDVITGTIKANFPTRISFQVSSRIDSRTILGEMGAEQLLGQGDMLYMAVGGRITRVHGPFVSDSEVEHVVANLKAQGKPHYVESILSDLDDEDGSEVRGDFSSDEGDSGKNDLYDQAVACVLRDKRVSTSYIQRRLQIGYNRAASLMERMEKEGIVSPPNHAGKRMILLSSSDGQE